MRNQAFHVLGIAPTDDGRAIRAAFLRLARIYHPDRFVDMPQDVRDEAERRMKEATVAYESLRTANNGAKPKQPDDEIDEEEVHQRALKYREVARRKREKDERDRDRWQRWQKVEEIARKKAKLEADIAARVTSEVDGPDVGASEAKPSDPPPIKAPQPVTRDRLSERLDAARRGEKSPLVRRT